MFTSVVILANLSLLLDCPYITHRIFYTTVGSVALYFVFVLLHNSILVNPTNPVYYDIWHLGKTGQFWFSVILVQAFALLPGLFYRVLNEHLRPTAAQIVREREVLGRRSVEDDPLLGSGGVGSGGVGSGSGSSNGLRRSPDEGSPHPLREHVV